MATDTQQLHLDFWTQFGGYMRARHPGIAISKAGRREYAHVLFGPSHIELSLVNDTTQRPHARLHFVIKEPRRDERFAKFKAQHKEELEAKLGTMKWQNQPPQMRLERSSSLSDRSTWPQLNEWFGDNVERWVAALLPILDSI